VAAQLEASQEALSCMSELIFNYLTKLIADLFDVHVFTSTKQEVTKRL
jgi:hypothetical protein